MGRVGGDIKGILNVELAKHGAIEMNTEIPHRGCVSVGIMLGWGGGGGFWACPMFFSLKVHALGKHRSDSLTD